MKARLRTQSEVETVAVFRNGDALREQAIDRIRLVQRYRHQRSKHISMRGGASPLAAKLFSVLKVSALWLKYQFGGEKLNVPPFGASALA